jgi:hypothetical protein
MIAVRSLRLPVFAALAAAILLAGCAQGSVTQIDARTFQIKGPGTPGPSDAPNRRMAAAVCPGGYQVLDRVVRYNTPDGYSEEPGVYTNWKIRCL